MHSLLLCASGRFALFVAMDGRFDDMLLGLAQKHRGIEDLMFTVLSFFERRTDLLHIKASPDDKKGYLEGKAREAIRGQFRHFQTRYLQRAQPHLIYQRPAAPAPERPRAALEASAAAAATSSGYPADATDSSGGTGDSPDSAGGGGAPPVAPAPAAGSTQPRPIPDGVNASPLEGGDPGMWERIQKSKDKYKWQQSVQEVIVEIDVEKCKASDLKIVFKPRSISVKRKGEVLLEGQLHDKINTEESTWHLDEGKQIVISMEKIRSMWWEELLEGSGASGTASAAA